MEYGYQKVMEVQRRCGINFEDADRALKAEKGDADKACVYAMRRKKNAEARNRQVGRFRNFITYRVIISKDGKSKVDVSTGVVLLISFLALIFSLGVDVDAFVVLAVFYLSIIVITIFTGNAIKLVPDSDSKDLKLETVEKSTKSEEEVYEENVEHEVEAVDDGFNSIEIK